MPKLNIPDPNFYKLLVENLSPDKNTDITIEELQSVKKINCSNKKIPRSKG